MKKNRASSDVDVEYMCPVCDFALWLPLVKLKVSVLGLYDDARFPGRCILALNEHAEDFSRLKSQVARDFFEDCQKAARAIQAAVGVERVNIAILGNEVAHVHFHLIPRRPLDEPIPTRPPWEHPAAKYALPEDQRLEISTRIKEEAAEVLCE
jgi:diadenosine tetraphosphate (Ap4A) HIT family hydrolase